MNEPNPESELKPADRPRGNLRSRAAASVIASPPDVSATVAPPPPTPPAVPADPAFRGVAGVIHCLLRDRALAWVLLLGAALYFGVSWWLGRPIHRCLFRALTGWPCPGCGLSRAISLMIRGRWRESLQLHLFGVYAMLWGVMLAGAAFLPRAWQEHWATIWARLETRTRIHTVVGVAFGLHGFVRLLGAALGRP